MFDCNCRPMSSTFLAAMNTRAADVEEKEREEYQNSTVKYRRSLTHDEKVRMFKLLYGEPWPDEEDREPFVHVECDVCGAYRNTDLDDFSGQIVCGSHGNSMMFFCEECWEDYLAAEDEDDYWNNYTTAEDEEMEAAKAEMEAAKKAGKYPTAQEVIAKYHEEVAPDNDDMDAAVYDILGEWDEQFEDDKFWFIDPDEAEFPLSALQDVKDNLRDEVLKMLNGEDDED